ncbi:hypothetical protein JB92DRAFT_2827300 [Gautieria morchelliformis]|nr:hypothetical protein JB92DRAFT_2827300 [Gautieria morchelliformis]
MSGITNSSRPKCRITATEKVTDPSNASVPALASHAAAKRSLIASHARTEEWRPLVTADRTSLTVRDVPRGHANNEPELLITDNTTRSHWQGPLLKLSVKTICYHNLEPDGLKPGLEPGAEPDPARSREMGWARGFIELSPLKPSPSPGFPSPARPEHH